MRTLCRVEEIPEGGVRGFGPSPGGFTGLIATRLGGRVLAYVNACPHVGVALDKEPGRFRVRDGQVVCAAHGAVFALEGGACVAGPCVGERLEAVAVTVVDGQVLVPADAGL